VLVREDDAGDVVDMAANKRQPLGDLAAAETRIDEKRRRVGLNQRAIAGAAATQNRDVHPHGGDSTRSATRLKLSAREPMDYVRI